MTIFFSSKYNGLWASQYGNSAESTGIPGFPELGGKDSGITPDVIKVRDQANEVIQKLIAKYSAYQETSFVVSGRQPAVGSPEGGKLPLLDDKNERQIYSQTPSISVVIKKRVFSSLKHLYNPVYMDSAEKWLFRATKRLIQRKCQIMAEYERLTKISRLVDEGISLSAILANLEVSEALNDAPISSETKSDFETVRKIENLIRARQPVSSSTYFIDPYDPNISDLGLGQGTFEITTITDLRTNLDLSGNGDCSFTIEDPYRILFVNDDDIEMSIKETALSYVPVFYRDIIANTLNASQITDSSLTASRLGRAKSSISFNVGITGVLATLDYTGMQLTESNLSDVPDDQALTDDEKALFKSTIKNLKEYQDAIRNDLEKKKELNSEWEELSTKMEYVRKRMRIFYLGKYLIQPMDSVHVFIDGGTRKFGVGSNIDNTTLDSEDNIFYTPGANVYTPGVEVELLQREYEIYKRDAQNPMSFQDFKRLRILQLGRESGIHSFGGIVKSVSDSFDASSGKFVLSVAAVSNLEWLKMSRYNSQPSLDQTQGMINDPLTPFQFKTDPATGLPTGKIELSPDNKTLLGGGGCRKYFTDTGPEPGKLITTEKDMSQDIIVNGGNIVTLFEHVPGLQYRWKEGIMTSTYNMYMRDPENNSLVDPRQFRRDVGFFWSNQAFENLDAANIISILVAGTPYNPSSFVQSSKLAFVPNSSVNTGRDFFTTFLDLHRSTVMVNGNFIPFKTINVSREELTRSINLQLQLTGKSAELQQLRTKKSDLEDKINNFNGSPNSDMKPLSNVLNAQLDNINKQIDKLETEYNDITKKGKELQNSVVQVAGNDISFDIAQTTSNSELKLFGDRLLYLTLRKREDVIYNTDKNLLIISDEYDKDYDIQSFVLQMRQQSPEVFKSTWMDVSQLCRTVAETLDFELFCNTQGHIVFRPPQYNRIPISIYEAMLRLKRLEGIRLFPEFLESLYESREASLIRDIVSIEWEIIMKGALLGCRIDRNSGDVAPVKDLIFKQTGSYPMFLKDSVLDSTGAIINNEAMASNERNAVLSKIGKANYELQLNSSSAGMFSAVAQSKLQKNVYSGYKPAEMFGDKESYDYAKTQVSRYRGTPANNFEEFDKIKVGAVKNGQSVPSSDIARTISEISELISQRSRLLRTLEKVMTQIVEFSSVSGDGSTSINPDTLFTTDTPSDITIKLFENDKKDYLGFMSGSRFIIKDEHIISSTFTEQPPDITSITVKGGEPILGMAQEGDAIGTNYIAFGVDFDMWRQYGWRSERTVEKPFFTSAELQSAPYAVMLLSRQRKNIVTGTVTVMGNEYYQLGDTVYLNDRRLLYYVYGISHSFTYGGNFTTTLTLNYGHPPGDYIPTPLDVIGKMATLNGRAQNAYRVRRQLPNTNVLLGIVQFDPSDTQNNMLGGKFGMKNYNELVKSAIAAKIDINVDNPNSSSKVFIMSYSGDEGTQQTRRDMAKQWFMHPEQPEEVKNGIGMNGAGGTSSPTNTSPQDNTQNTSDYVVSQNVIEDNHLKLCLPSGGKLTSTEEELIKKHRIVASQESISLDPSLENIIEIRLVQPPDGGW